jgi:hypothetical protein
MTQYFAKRVRFRNGERISVLQRPHGLPVQEATLFLDRFRTRGRAANTIHFVCSTLAIVHRELDSAGICLLERLGEGRFLTRPELSRLATAAQYHAADRSKEYGDAGANVISIHRVYPKLTAKVEKRAQVDVATGAKRLRYMAGYLEFLSDYVKATLPKPQAKEFVSK